MNKMEVIPIAKFNEKIDFSTKQNILIAGKGSYIGDAINEFLSRHDNYDIEFMDTLSEKVENFDFSKFDCVINVAGIAHIKETDENRNLYYEVNRDLAYDIAKRAKDAGVKQYIFMSTMSVYGVNVGDITESTKLLPVNAYGKSKNEAEQLIWNLKDENFVVSIIRPPMVYGKNCKGNYQKLRKFANKYGVFVKLDNERSMIYVRNLASVVRNIIHNNESGVYFPQNSEYVSSKNMVELIAKYNEKHVKYLPGASFFIKKVFCNMKLIEKVFGDLRYDKNLNVPLNWLYDKDFEKTIKESEEK